MQSTIEWNRTSTSVVPKSSDSPIDAIQPEPQPHNPYLAARREWDERYGDLVARRIKSDRIALICAISTVLLAVIAGALALRGPKIILIPVDAAGHYLGPGSPAQSLVVSESMQRAALSDWVTYL